MTNLTATTDVFIIIASGLISMLILSLVGLMISWQYRLSRLYKEAYKLLENSEQVSEQVIKLLVSKRNMKNFWRLLRHLKNNRNNH